MLYLLPLKWIVVKKLAVHLHAIIPRQKTGKVDVKNRAVLCYSHAVFAVLSLHRS